MAVYDPFQARDTFDTGSGTAGIYRLSRLEDAKLTSVARLPYSIRILLEAVLRNCDRYAVTERDVTNLAGWQATATAAGTSEIPFKPARVILQDFTGVPCVVDLAAMRRAMQRLGGDPKKINPLVPVDLVIDHSVQVDFFGGRDSMDRNVAIEFDRNRERYEFLRWGQKAFRNFRVVPPAVGIVHQVNLEYLAKGVFLGKDNIGPVAFPDSLVGTDSHTTMINGLGVLGWGVGGIEAEAVMLGQPLYMLAPEVIGFELSGELPPGTTATDLVLTVTQILRKEGVVNKFVEYFGPAIQGMKVADRALVANMAPEYGATMGFFPIDEQTLNYLRLTGRSDAEVALVERYTKEQQLFYASQPGSEPVYTKVLKLDLGTIEPSLAGPKRPQDRVPLANVKRAFRQSLQAPVKERGFGLGEQDLARTATISPHPLPEGEGTKIGHGAVVIAAITSCTNTSNPDVMLAAGLVAKKAVERGLTVKPYVKTSLAPGSRVVTDYYRKTGLDAALNKLGFNLVGYGCTTCIGNSGPLPEPVAEAVSQGNLVAAAVLSGNRNFEGRINKDVKANYLASPPLVVAYALAGTVDIDLASEPLGTGSDGKSVYLKDLWPSREEVGRVVADAIGPEMFRAVHECLRGQSHVERPAGRVQRIVSLGCRQHVRAGAAVLDRPGRRAGSHPIAARARVLAALGDSVTTDHISPAGSIAASSPAGRYLQERGVKPVDFNSYGARRGNDRVMTRGTFANIRIHNLLAPGTEGGVTRHLPDGQVLPIYDAAMQYKAEGVPLVVLAGAEYGTGSSRDWAAKGTYLLGVRAVLAVSFERIHRSNLVGMGILPLEFPKGKTWESLGLTGEEVFEIPDLNDRLVPRSQITVRAVAADGSAKEFQAKVRIDTPIELDYYRNGGILQTVLRKLAKEGMEKMVGVFG